jgi:hypothetical protein
MRRKNRRTVARLAGFAVVTSTLVAFSMAGAAHAAPPCAITINACGCTISTSGTYTVTKNLTAASGTTCIEIAAPSTVLEILNHATISGTGQSGTGVLVDKGSDYSVIAGVRRTPVPPPPPGPIPPIPVPAPGNEGNIVGFSNGIEVDANNVVVEFFDHLNTNSTAGVFLNNVSNATVGGFCADRNGVAGVVAVGTTGSRIYNFTAEKNGFDGLLLNDSDGNSIYNFTTILNKVDGILLQGSSSNALTTGSSESNGADGVRIGSNDSPANPYDTDSVTSNYNHVTTIAATQLSPFDIVVDNCGEVHTPRLLQVNGIHVEEGDSSNVIAGNLTSYGPGINPLDNTAFNLLDDNAGCDNNTWTNNLFGAAAKVKPPCAGNP